MLDRLLEDERLHIAAISGTSAGAMNAVAIADGMASGGPSEARKRLESFWSATSAAARFSPDPAIADRHDDGQLEPRQLAGLYRDGVFLAPFFTLRLPIRSTLIRCPVWCAAASTSTGSMTRTA